VRFPASVLLIIAASGCSSPEAPAPCDPRVERGGRISSRGAALHLCVGGTLDLAFDVWECASHFEYTSSAAWSTDKLNIAVVEAGVVRGVATGTAKISATVDTRTDSIDVLVTECFEPPIDAGVDAASDSSDAD